MRVEVRKLGLAAYMKMKDVEFKGYDADERHFVFESDRDEREWYVEYLNTDCHRHDTELMGLRTLMRR